MSQPRMELGAVIEILEYEIECLTAGHAYGDSIHQAVRILTACQESGLSADEAIKRIKRVVWENLDSCGV